MTNSTVSELLHSDKILQEVSVKGWVRTFRANRFIALNDFEWQNILRSPRR